MDEARHCAGPALCDVQEPALPIYVHAYRIVEAGLHQLRRQQMQCSEGDGGDFR